LRKEGWTAVLASSGKRQEVDHHKIGHRWIEEGNFAVVHVHSIITGEPNYVLNPLHAGFSLTKIDRPKPFKFDRRLLAKK
jgi:hypothetical protein